MLQLARCAARLNREAGSPPLPALFFFTDPIRTPDPLAIAARLPRGAAVVYRHFGAGHRYRIARALARLCARRGLSLLVSSDPALMEHVGAAGVHWPQARAPDQRGAGLATMAAHDLPALERAARLGMDAAVLSPVFPSRSASGREPLGLFRATQLARSAQLPVVALGGVNADTAPQLFGRGFSGLASVDGIIEVSARRNA